MQVPDLGALGRKDLELTPEQMVQGEAQAGLRCTVCLRRFTNGVEVVILTTQFHPEAGLVGVISHAYCCEQESCRDAVVEGAVAVRPIQQLFLTPDPFPEPKGGEENVGADSPDVGEGPGADGAAQSST